MKKPSRAAGYELVDTGEKFRDVLYKLEVEDRRKLLRDCNVRVRARHDKIQFLSDGVEKLTQAISRFTPISK